MRWNIVLLLFMAFLPTACRTSKPGSDAAILNLGEFQVRAARYHSVIALPSFETTTNQIAATQANTVAAGNAGLDRIGKLTPRDVNFDNTIRALDDLGFQLGLVANRLALIEQTSTNA